MSIKTFTGKGDGSDGGSANEDQRVESELRLRLQVGGWPRRLRLRLLRERISMHIARIFHKFHSIFIKHKKYGLRGDCAGAGAGWQKRRTQQILHRKSSHYARLVINLWKIKRENTAKRKRGKNDGNFRAHRPSPVVMCLVYTCYTHLLFFLCWIRSLGPPKGLRFRFRFVWRFAR